MGEDKFTSRIPKPPSRRDFLKQSLLYSAAALGVSQIPEGNIKNKAAGERSSKGGSHSEFVDPTLPCATLVIGGGNTTGMFKALETGKLLPGGKKWSEFLRGKKVIGIGCAAGVFGDAEEVNRKSIESWCQKQDFHRDGKIEEYSKEKGKNFYWENGAEAISFIKDAAYNKKHEKDIIKAINDPNTCLFDFSGGDQDYMMWVLKQTPKILEALQQRWITDPGLLVYTTSASAAALSKYMMSEGHIREGMGWLVDILVDMHMLRIHENDINIDDRRERLQKGVKQCVKNNPELIGIGVDEATTLVLRRGFLEVGRARVPVERMFGTIIACQKENGAIRYGSGSRTHNIYVVGKDNCDTNKTKKEELPVYGPVAGQLTAAIPENLSGLLTKLTKLKPGQFQEAMQALPLETQSRIRAALKPQQRLTRQ